MFLNTNRKVDAIEFSYPMLRELYDDIELAIVFDWLGVERLAELKDVDITKEWHDEEEDWDAPGEIRLLQFVYKEYGDVALSNAVARLVLSKVQNRLPEWAMVKEGQVIRARKYFSYRRHSIEPIPRFQLEINWADSGPGFSWPETYYSTFLPGFELFIVTASQDCSDAYGVTDEAIDCFLVDGKFSSEKHLAGVRKSICGWWKYQADGWDQARWEYLFSDGEVDSDTAIAWADEVWAETA